MNNFQNFIFKDYDFNVNAKELRLYYSYDGILDFCESFRFDFDFVTYDTDVLDRAFQTLFFMAGVSYYKAYLAPNIIVDKGEINESTSRFLSKTYQKGLGEFFFVNKINPNHEIKFPVNSIRSNNITNFNNEGIILGIGGGKDSLVSLEFLVKSNINITTWSLGHRAQLEPLINRIGLKHLWVERQWDRKLIELNEDGAYNGHVPISAILAVVGTIVAILSGNSDVVVSNENSANESDLVYEGIEINHQYSKSLEFEKDYQKNLQENIGGTQYYSFLRPLSEVYIAEIFSKVGLDKYIEVFSSCNRAFTHKQSHIFWCGECPKCAFTFLALTPFVDKNKLESIWHKNLLTDPKLEPVYRQLLGIDGDKPLDCVGEIKESRAAMRLAQTIYPELNKYVFEIPQGYGYKKLYDHSMPQEVYEILKENLNKLNF